MVDQASFIEAVRSVQKIMQAEAGALSKEEIQSYFQDMDLSQEQQEMIYQYLQNPQQAFGEEAGKGKQAAPGPAKASGGSQKKGAPSGMGSLYLREIEATPVLSRTQELELYGSLLAGEESAIARINRQWLGRLVELAGEYASKKACLEELVQEGNVGLLVGLDRLLGKGEMEEAALVEGKLESYIREFMEEYCRRVEGTEYQEKLLLAKVNFVHEAQKLLAEENFALPTVSELADYTRMPEDEVRAILSLSQEKDS